MDNQNESLQNVQKFEINCMGEPTVDLRGLKVLSKNKKSIIIPEHQQLDIPEEKSPYITSHTLAKRLSALKNPAKYNTGIIVERLKSAKLIRMKELESELNLKRNQLNEVITENRLLKSLQHRQDYALRKYEGSKGQLPQLIQSHSEEIRALRAKYKMVSAQNRDLEKRLRDREMELQALKEQHRYLLRLSKDRNLEEREKLRDEVASLKIMLESKDFQLQDLARKRAIEQKVHQQQLQQEIKNSKECRKALILAERNIHRLEALLEPSGKDLITKGINHNANKITKEPTAPTQRFSTIDLVPQENSESFINLRMKHDVEKKVYQSSDKKSVAEMNEYCLHLIKESDALQIEKKYSDKRESLKDSDIKNDECRVIESVKTSEDFHLSSGNSSCRYSKDSESHRENITKSNIEGEDGISNEGKSSTNPEREVSDASQENDFGIKGTEMSLGCEAADVINNPKELKDVETPHMITALDSTKKVKLLRALKVRDNEELTDSDTSDVDSGLSTSQTKSKGEEKDAIKSTSDFIQAKTINEGRHSSGNSSRKLTKDSSVRHLAKADLMHELFGTLPPSSKTRSSKNKNSEISVCVLEDIRS